MIGSLDSFGERLVLAGAALGALVYLARMAYRATKKVIEFAQRLEKVVHNVEDQLYPNGGSSLRDAVNNIQTHLGIPVTQPSTPPSKEVKP